MIHLSRDRLSRARELFGQRPFLGQTLDAFRSVFECLGPELSRRATVLVKPEHPLANAATLQQLARRFAYASFRFTELLTRLNQLNWMQAQFERQRGEEGGLWFHFAALAIKDFHIDLSSLMDAVALTILQAVHVFDEEGQSYLPGFATIQKPPCGKRGRH